MMSPLRSNDEHLSNDSFIRSVEANPDKIIAIMLHPKYVSVQQRRRSWKAIYAGADQAGQRYDK